MEWYLKVLKQYADFNGRARRKEYWMFVLFNMLIVFGIGVVSGILNAALQINLGIISVIYSLATLIPGIAVSVRRMHDIDRRGWWLLVPIIGIVFLFFDSTPGENRFGENPKDS